MSDAPLGVFLSGGVDSSAVAALMTKKKPGRDFLCRIPEGAYSELPYARIVARHLNSVHHEVLVS